MTTTTSEQVANQSQAVEDPFAKMDSWLNSSSSGTSKWIRLQSGESITLIFDEHKVNTVERDFGDGRKVPRAEYVVTTADGSERTIEFSKSWAQQIQNLLKKGHRKIEVTRQGVGKDTKYFFVPA
jgi:hypothetical protein